MLRISGRDSIAIVDHIFRGREALAGIEGYRFVYGTIIHTAEKDEIIDEVIVSIFRAPHSYTGEDVVEISCHGGFYIVHEVLQLVLKNGARFATPGEFTKRAFLNGKIDLLQAESINDIINLKTRQSFKLARKQMSGDLSKRIFELRDGLKHQLVFIETELDFSEEDIEFVSRQALREQIKDSIGQIERLLETFTIGKKLRDGVHVVLAGKTNVGKSSVLNRLLQEDRAIVSEEPGTTRDSIEESIDVQGILFKITDTAGLRKTRNTIEAEGVNRTRDLLQRADLVCFIIDVNNGINGGDLEAFEVVKKEAEETKRILIMNKMDLTNRINDENFIRQFEYKCELSAKTGYGFEEFKEAMISVLFGEGKFTDQAFINRERHKTILQNTRQHLFHLEKSIENKLSSEYIAFDLRAALDTLSELTGLVTTEDILDEIFSTFCIGK